MCVFHPEARQEQGIGLRMSVDLGMTTKHSMAENDMSMQLPHTMEVAANKGWEMQDPSVAVKLEAR